MYVVSNGMLTTPSRRHVSVKKNNAGQPGVSGLTAYVGGLMLTINPETQAHEIRRYNDDRVKEEDRAKCQRRRRIEDFKLAREMGISIEDLIPRRCPNCGHPNTRKKTAKYCSDKCRKAAYDKRRTDR
jgi:hypothetical protein